MSGRKLIRNVNDCIIGIALLALGVYVLTTNDIVQGNIATSAGGPLVRPDVYVRLIGGCMAFFAAILVIKAINFSGAAETRGFHFVISRETALTIAALIVYTLLLPLIGFAVSTFLLIFFLTCLYIRKEKSGAGKAVPAGKTLRRDLGVALAYSALLDLAVYLLFSRVLKVALP
jgi:hypothetical protein